MSFGTLSTGGGAYVPPSSGLVNVELPRFTCVSCGLVFPTSEAQQQHFRTDFHNYNLKRKVLDYAPVTEEEFIAIQKEEIEKQSKQGGKRQRNLITCEACDKTFSSESAYQQHCKTKKHKDSVARTKKQTAKIIPRSEMRPPKKTNAKNPVSLVPSVPLPDSEDRSAEPRAVRNLAAQNAKENAANVNVDINVNKKKNEKKQKSNQNQNKPIVAVKEEDKEKDIDKVVNNVEDASEEDIYGEADELTSEHEDNKKASNRNGFNNYYGSEEIEEEEEEEEEYDESDLFEGSEETQAWRYIGRCVETGKVPPEEIDNMVWDLILSKRPRFSDDECPFCSYHQSNFEELLKHMELKHDFRIPDREYCINEEAVLFYVQDKIAVGRQCLMCGRIFNKVKNLRDHMNALSHTRFAMGKFNNMFDDKGILKYYDFSSMWDEAYKSAEKTQSKFGLIKDRVLALLPGFAKKSKEQNRDMDERFGLPKSFLKRNKFVPSSNVGMSVLGITKKPDTNELILPDGRVVGHRDLKKYYEQDEIGLKALVSSEMAIRRRRDNYLKGNTTSSCTDIVLAPTVGETRMMYMQMNKERFITSFRAHKLVKHFVDQNMVFQVPK